MVCAECQTPEQCSCEHSSLSIPTTKNNGNGWRHLHTNNYKWRHSNCKNRKGRTFTVAHMSGVNECNLFVRSNVRLLGRSLGHSCRHTSYSTWRALSSSRLHQFRIVLKHKPTWARVDLAAATLWFGAGHGLIRWRKSIWQVGTLWFGGGHALIWCGARLDLMTKPQLARGHATSLHRRPKGWNSLQLGSVLDAGGYCCRFVRMCVGVSMGMCVYAVMFIFPPRNLRGCLTCICESRFIWEFGVRIQRNIVVFLFDCIA